jgi:hypothetical protein
MLRTEGRNYQNVPAELRKGQTETGERVGEIIKGR